MRDNFEANGNFWAFEIEAWEDRGEYSELHRYGDDHNQLEIQAEFGSGRILWIGSGRVGKVLEGKCHLPGFDDPSLDDLADCYDTAYLSAYGENISEFMLHLDGNVLDIVFSEDYHPEFYGRIGRVEYYYDYDLNLVYIKVLDLSEEEYSYFKQYARKEIE